MAKHTDITQIYFTAKSLKRLKEDLLRNEHISYESSRNRIVSYVIVRIFKIESLPSRLRGKNKTFFVT